ncbi:MAG TPA: alpha/beta family hydrolase [Herpetosiphonaceae bacterium]
MEASAQQREVRVRADSVVLDGTLSIPDHPQGIVVFAHGSGSSRHSPRNRAVARTLQEAGLATLLFDLLTQDEEAIDRQTAKLRFDIGLLARRLVGATDWLGEQPATAMLRIGYFGSSTGAGAALVAAAERSSVVGAIVSRGGRPDLAGAALDLVQAPTLLVVGGADTPVIALNEAAARRLHAVRQLEIIPGATHLFEEPGALERVAQLAARWFSSYLRPADAEGDLLREAARGG